MNARVTHISATLVISVPELALSQTTIFLFFKPMPRLILASLALMLELDAHAVHVDAVEFEIID